MRPGGSDAGGYRYTAFGTQMPADATTPSAQFDQPLRWKGRLFTEFVPGAGLYDVRARAWSPEMGAFTSIDEYAYHDARSTLWGWPGENPIAAADPSGHCPWCIAIGMGIGVLGMGASAPSDTSQAPSNVLGMMASVPGLGPATGAAAKGLLEASLPIVERVAPDVANVLSQLVKGGRLASRGAELAESCPQPLTKASGGEMLGEALGRLRQLPGSGRVAVFRDLAGEITEATSGQWSATELDAANGTIFAGEGGEALVFDSAGNMFRGQLADESAFARAAGGRLEIDYGQLRSIK